MEYIKRMLDADGTYAIQRVYPDGRRRNVSEQQDIYQAWLADGNVPAVVPYETPVPLPPAPIPAERQQVYAAILDLWANQAGQGTVPTTYADALVALKAWVADAATVEDRLARIEVAQELAMRRLQMLEHGWPWEEFLRYVEEITP